MNAVQRLIPPSPASVKREARTIPASFKESDNSFDVCWSTGAAVTRFDWYDGEYYDETLSMEPGAVRLDRLNDGGPVLDSHDDFSLGGLVGSIVPGSARVAAGQGLARVRLAESEDVAAIVAKIKGGHLRKISVGYRVHAYERIERDGQAPELRAVDWEPLEISLVSVPADPGAQIRSERPMNMPSTEIARRRDERAAEAARERELEGGAAVAASFIRKQCRSLGFDDATTLNIVESFTEEPHTRAEFLEAMVERVAQQRAGRGGFGEPVGPIDASDTSTGSRRFDGPGGLMQRMQGALYARIAGKEPVEESREFMGASMIDMARGLLIARGEKAQWLSPVQIWQRYGAQTTSDFTQLLNAATNAYLVEQYAATVSPLLQIASKREVRDFKDVRPLAISASAELLLVEENAEYQYGYFNESGESYKVNTLGRIMSLSRQAIINDNLGAFVQAGRWYVRSAGSKRADIIAAVVFGNPTLADGVALFHANHSNLAASGTALSVTSLSDARLALRNQKDRDGVTYIEAAPKYLVIGPKNETVAEQLMTALAAAQVSQVNPFPGKLTVLVDVRITDYAWYLFADPGQAPVVEYATLTGQGDSVYTDTRIGFEVDAVETKARIDFGAGIVDFRGAYKNPGAAPA